MPEAWLEEGDPALEAFAIPVPLSTCRPLKREFTVTVTDQTAGSAQLHVTDRKI